MKLDLDNIEIEALIRESRVNDSRKRHKIVRSSLTPKEIPAIVYIAFQPGAYTSPHMHPDGNQENYVIRGEIQSFFFNEMGDIDKAEKIKAGTSITYPKGVYHTAIATKPDTLVRELFWGIFDENNYKIFPDWAVPEKSDKQPIRDFMDKLSRKI